MRLSFRGRAESNALGPVGRGFKLRAAVPLSLSLSHFIIRISSSFGDELVFEDLRFRVL